MNRWLRVAYSVLAVSSMSLPALAGDVPASGTKAGSVTALLPTAHLSRTVNSKDVTKDAAKGDDVFWQDTIRTEKGGRARITLTDQSILSVGSQAELKVIKHDAKTQQTQLELTYGKIRAEVTTVTKDGGGFEVKTPTAVAGVIGTVFGMDSSPVETSFLCMSGLVNIRSTDPSIGGTTSCEAGKVVVMGAGKAPVKRNATPEEYQKFFSDTETATITGMWPWAGLPGSTIEAKANGAHLDGVTSVTSSNSAIGVAMKPATDTKGTSLNLHLTVAENAKPGAYVLTFKKPGGAQTAAVFLVLGPPGTLDDIDSLLNSYLESIDEERHAALGALNAVQSELAQAADLATGQLSAANTAAKPPLDLSKTGANIQEQTGALQTDLASSQEQVNAASDAAKKDFTTRFTSAATALKARSANGKPDAQFRSSLASAFTDVNTALTKTVGGMVDALSDKAATLEAAITALENDEMAAITKATPGGTIAGQAVEQGFVANFDAGTLGSVAPLKWSICDTSYKPSKYNVALPPNAPGCTPVPGYESNAAAFAVNSCDLKPANYAVRLTNGNNSYDTSLKVIAPAYDDPVSRLQGLALAYSALTPDVFMEYFDQVNFPGYSKLAENIRRTMETLDTMSIRIIVDDVSINCNDATIRSEWQENYSFHQSPNHIQHLTPQQMTVKLSRTPGKGWFITALNGDNGTVQGLPVGPVLTDAPAPQLAVLDVNVVAVVGGAPVRASAPAAPTVPVVPLGPVKFSATVSNTGSADVNLPLEVEFFLLDGKGKQIDTGTTILQPPLVAGKTNTVQGILNIPTTVPGGSLLQVGVRVNPGCKVQVTLCDASNLTTLQVQVGAVDLAVKTIAATAQLVGTLAGSIDVTIDNVGKQASAATTGNLLLTSPVFAGTLKGNIPSIPAGGSAVISFPLAALPNISGARNFTATINPVPTGDIDTGDKTLTTALSILTAVDMQVVSIAPAAPVVEGQPETFNVTLKNLGGATSTASTGNLQLLVGTTLLAAGDTPAIAPGATVVVPVAVTLPVAVGSRNFTAKLSPAVALDANAANDSLTTPFTLAPAVDIQIVSIGSTGSLVEAQAGTMTVTLQNNGAITSTATTGNLKLSGPSGPLGTANIPAIAAGASTTVSFNVTVPTVAGGTSFSAQITPKVPLDLDATNDTLTQTLTVLAAVDIQVVSIGSSGSLIEAQPGTITVTLKNLGAGTSTATTRNLNISGTSGALASANIPAIGPGATTTISVPVTVPTVTGNSTFVAQISPAVPLDVSSANDTLSQNLPVLAAVDIRVVSITNSGGTLVENQPASFTVTLKNNGAITSTATTGNLLLSGPSGPPLASANIPAIASGASTPIVIGVTLPAISGSNNFTAAVSPAVPLDLNSANDSLTTAFNITGNFVDLKVTAFALRQTTGLLSGNGYGFSMSVQNNGNVASSASDTLSCVATGPNFSGSVSLPLATTALASIAPGATSSFADTLTLPKNLAGADTFTCTAGGDPNEAAGTLADNTASTSAGVSFNVNLRFSSTQAIPAALQMGSSVTFNATVTNDGPDDAPANYSLQSMLNSVVSGTIAGVAIPALGTHTFAVPILVPQIGTAPQDVSAVAGQVSIIDGTGFTETNSTDNVFSNSTFRLLDFEISTSKTTMRGVTGRTLSGTAYTVLPSTYQALFPGLTVTPTGIPSGLSLSGGTLSGTLTASPGAYSATFSGASKGITHAATAALPFTVRPEITFTETSTPAVQEGGAAGTLAGTVNGGVGNLSVALPTPPTGITFTGTSPQTVAAGGTVTWGFAADTTATVGSANLSLTATDAGVSNTFETVPGGNVTVTANYSVSVASLPNFVITSAQFVNHGAPPYIGAAALQLGEAAQMAVTVKNTGSANPAPGATVQVVMSCNSSCGVAGTSATATAPNMGASATVTFSVGTVTDLPGTGYPGTATVSASVSELSTADNTKSVLWDVVDFAVVESTGWPSTQNMHLAVASNIGFNVTESGGSSAFAIPITVTAGVSGIGVPAKASFAPAATDYTANITVPVSTPTGADTITFTGTNYGVSHSFTQNVNYYTAGLVSTTLFTNSSSQPLNVPVNNGAGVTLELQMQGNYITPNGSSGATISLDNAAAPFMTFHAGATTALPGDNIGVVVADPTTSTLLAPGAFKINSVVPATIPQDTLTYFLWVFPVGTSQLAVSSISTDLTIPIPISSLYPWVSGETLPWTATVINNGTAKSKGGELLEVYFNNTSTGNVLIAQTTVPVSLSPGTSTNISLNLTAPDGNLANTTTVEAHVHQDPPNNSLGVTQSPGWITSDWGFVIGNPGNADSTPVVPAYDPNNGGQFDGTAAWSLVIPGGGRGAQFRTTPTVKSGITPNAKYFTQALTQTGLSGTALETLVSFGAANDFYTSQVTASIGSVSRQGTIHIQNTAGTAAQTVVLSSTDNNVAPIGTTPPTSVQINGYVVESLDLTGKRSGGAADCVAGVQNNCNFELTLTPDAAASGYGANGEGTGMSYGTPTTFQFTANLNPATGALTTGSSTVTASVTGAQTNGTRRGQPKMDTNPQPVGTQQFGLAFTVADLAVTFPTCVSVPPGTSLGVPLSWTPINGYNAPSVGFQWVDANFNVISSSTISPNSGSATPKGNTTFTVTSTAGGTNTTAVTYYLDVTLFNSQGVAGPKDKLFPVTFDLTAAGGICGASTPTGTHMRKVGSHAGASPKASQMPATLIAGVYGREHVSSLNSGARKAVTALPDLQISAKDVNYAPSLPKQGDALQVRFRMTNAGTADAKQVPIVLMLNGKTVASDTFDLKAGASSLGALNWTVTDKAGSGPVNAHVAVDPMHTVIQASTTAKTAALAHFTLPGSGGVIVASNSKIAHLEVAEGSCVGFRFAAGAGGGCGSADLELSVEDLANGKYILNGRNGVADLGVGRTDASNATYGMQALVVTGHTYAVQLSGKNIGLFTVQRVRSPRQLSEKSDRTFGHVRNVPIGKGSGATQTGDVSGGSGKRNEAFVYFDVQYATQ